MKDEAVDASRSVVAQLTFEDGIAGFLMCHPHVLEETRLLFGAVIAALTCILCQPVFAMSSFNVSLQITLHPCSVAAFSTFKIF